MSEKAWIVGRKVVLMEPGLIYLAAATSEEVAKQIAAEDREATTALLGYPVIDPEGNRIQLGAVLQKLGIRTVGYVIGSTDVRSSNLTIPVTGGIILPGAGN